MLWAVLLIMASCNKADDAVLEEASRVEANGGLALAVGPISASLDFSSHDFSDSPDKPFGIHFNSNQNQLTLDYVVNTEHSPVMNPKTISWDIQDDDDEIITYAFVHGSSSIQFDFNYYTTYTVTVDVTFFGGETLSSSFCVAKGFTTIGNPNGQVHICTDSDAEINTEYISCPVCGGIAFIYIFPSYFNP